MSSERLTKNGYTAVACYLGFLLSAGTVVQIITTKVLLLKAHGRQELTPYLLNIVVSNSLVILGSYPTTFVSSLRNGWYFSDVVCRSSGLLAGIGCIAMVVTMACITVKVHRQVKHQNAVVNHIIINKPKIKSYIKVLAAIWIYAFVVMLPPLVGWTGMVLEASETNCVPDWSPEKIPDKIYIVCMLLFAYVIPVGLSFCYLWKTKRKLSSHIHDMNQQFANIRVDSFKSIYKMSAVAVTAFSLAWLPYGLYVIISLCSSKDVFSAESTMVPALTAKTCVIINPFIYALVLPRFRQSVVRLLMCSKGNTGAQDTTISRRALANMSSTCSVSEKRHSQVINDRNDRNRRRGAIELSETVQEAGESSRQSQTYLTTIV